MSISYKDSGVNIQEGNEFVELISDSVKQTHNERVLSALGSFASLYDMSGMKNPVLVSGTDGVGTKILLALTHGELQGIGQDCVAMCVNDIICHGARPLFFLDYLACANLDKTIAAKIVEGISRACKECNCALVGGETAEMPGMYSEGDYDIAGFVLGVVNKEEIVDGNNIQIGDSIIGCASSGLHSNGFSLVRTLFPDTSIDFDGRALFHTLLEPTKLYVNSVGAVLSKFNTVQEGESVPIVRGLAHITGGGIVENLARILPQGLSAEVDSSAIPSQPIFELIMAQAKIEEKELWRTLNMGVGMTLVVDESYTDTLIEALNAQGERAFFLGKVTKTHDLARSTGIIHEEKICLY